MLFTTPEFLVFFAVVVALASASESAFWRKAVLLGASYFFYMWWNPVFILLLLSATAIAYGTALLLARSDDPGRRRLVVGVGISMSLALLGYFKYAEFVATNLRALLSAAGLPSEWRAPDVTLPVGISFYTFHTLSYVIDVYRGRTPASTSALDVAVYVAFFPQLVAGPIVRASSFLPQLGARIRFRCQPEDVFLVLQGVAKKALVADNLARLVDAVFSNVDRYPSLMIWLATVGFAVQLYCDFSGYTDIAIGISRMLGFRLPPNFDYPYLARNPTDFWRRWHISLSNWLRDYLYLSLPGNEKGPWHRRRNTIVTFLLAGLWHGSSWRFVAWGFAHGLMLVVHDTYGGWRRRRDPRYRPSSHPLIHLLSIATTQYFVLITMILFRAPSFRDAAIATQKFVLFDFDVTFLSRGLRYLEISSSAMIIVAFLVLHLIGRRVGGVDRWLSRAPLAAAAAACCVAGLLAVLFWPSGEAPFIYFQF